MALLYHNFRVPAHAVFALLWLLSPAFTEPFKKHYGQFFTDGPRQSSGVALTFDDGPGPETRKILEILKARRAKATFFMLGMSAERYPDLARQVREQGHLVANHTYSHLNLYSYKKEDREEKLKGEIRAGREAIRAASGWDPVFLRIPHGYMRDWVKNVARQEKTILVSWTYGSDWTPVSRERMLEGYLSRLRPGAILLFHDGGGNREKTAWLLEKILNAMENKKLRPLRIDEVLSLYEK
ncbi:MAG: polysaccharide deacetylase family protein [Elusimicrobia bacterium]|nr:polysaccharide deacetylase family protein [Elusimicrobiota bacterium]